MDPLAVLREYSKKLDQVHVNAQDSSVRFGERYYFSAKAPAYKRQDGEFYSLDCVVFFLKNRNLKPNEYLLAAKTSNVAQVQLQDRKKLLDYLDGLIELDAELAGPALPQHLESLEPSAKRPRIDDEATAMKSLQEVERQLRNRSTMLLAPTKDFKKVLDIFNVLKAKAKAVSAAPQKPSHPPSKPAPSSSAAAAAVTTGPKPSGRFDRDTTTEQLKAMAGGAVGNVSINMYGVAGSSSAAPAAPAAPAAGGSAKTGAGYVPLGGSGGGGKGSSSQQQPSSSSSHRPGVSSSLALLAKTPVASSSVPAAQKRVGVPIIIVPTGLTSLLNMYNARPFLEEGKFMTTAQAQAAAGGAPKASSVTFMRKAHRTTPVPYTVTDKPPAAGSADWERVVAVVVQGAKWQFKDWPHKGAAQGDLVEAFTKVCGFYLHYADEKLGPPVSEWNVKRMPLQREHRHKDGVVMLDLYKHLDTFLAARRSTLAY